MEQSSAYSWTILFVIFGNTTYVSQHLLNSKMAKLAFSEGRVMYSVVSTASSMECVLGTKDPVYVWYDGCESHILYCADVLLSS